MIPRRQLVLAMPWLVLACRRPPGRAGTARCAWCGMPVPPRSHWRAGGRSPEGADVTFCSPGCLFRRLLGRGSVRDPWVTEYYAPAGTRTDACALRYAVGSDVIGPMGPDLVPLAAAHEATFTNDHQPRRLLACREVGAAVLDALAGRR